MSAKNLFRKLMTKAFRTAAPAPIRRAALKRTTLAVEQVEERITPANYTLGSGDLTVRLDVGDTPLTVSQPGGPGGNYRFTLGTGTFTQLGGATATAGVDGSGDNFIEVTEATLNPGSGLTINDSLAVAATTASDNDVVFASGTPQVTNAVISLLEAAGGPDDITFNGGGIQGTGVNVTSATGGMIFNGAGPGVMGTTVIFDVAGGVTSPGAATTDVSANGLTITADAGIGAAGAPLNLGVASITTNTATGNGAQFLAEVTSAFVNGFNAGSGTVTLLAGTFSLLGSNIVNDATTIDVNGGTFAPSVYSDTIALLRLTTGTVQSGTGTLTSTAAVDARSGTLNANLGGTAGVTKTTAGTVTVGGTNTYTGATLVNGGTLAVTSAGALGTTAAGTTVAGGATLDVRTNIGTEAVSVGGTGVGGNGALIISTGTGTVGGAVTLTADAAIGGAGSLTVGGIGGGAFGVTKVGAGTTTLAGTNTYTGVTTVNGGTLLLTGSLTNGAAANDVVVNTLGTLGGTGTTNGGGVLVAGGRLAPGTTSPGVINTGNLAIGGVGSSYDVDLVAPYTTAGTGYDQTNVTGTVTLGPGTSPVLSLFGGTVAGTAGQALTIINNDGTDAVTGTFSGLPDGAMVTSGLFTAFVSYFGGDGNDVTLTVGGATPMLTGTGGDDSFEVRRVGGTTQVLRGGTVVYAAPTAAITTLQIDGGAGNDGLFVNFAGGNPIPSGGLTFNGGAQAGVPGDSITTGGGSFNTITYSFTNPNDGSLAFDPDGPGGTAASVLNYTGLEPVTDNNDATNRVLDYTALVSETITLQDDGNLGNNTSRVTSTQGETTTFLNPTATLTINAAAGGGAAVADTVVVTTLDTGLSGRTITINTGTAADTVNLSNGTNFAAATTLNVNTSGGDDAVNVSVNGANINLSVNTGAGAGDGVNVGFTAPGQSFGQGNLEGIFGTVNVTDAGDGLTLQVDDFADNDVDGAVTFTATSITGAADAGGSIGYLNVTTLNYNLPNVAGTPGDQVNVQSSAAGTTAILSGNAGDDAFTVGNASTVAGILGPVTLNGNAGADTVTYNSQNDASGTYVVTATTVQRTAPVANAVVTYGTIETLTVNTSNSAVGGDTVSVTGTAAGVTTTVNANDGTDTVTVTNTNATGPLTVNGGPALDTIVVGSTDTTTTGLGTGNLTMVAGAVTVNGNAGGADLIVDGSAAPVLANYQIISTTVTRSTPMGFGGVTYGTLTTLRLKTGTGPNIIDVPSTVVPTAILTSAGADTVNVGGTTALTLDNIAGPVTIDGGTGPGSTTDNDTVNVNDQNSAGSFTYTVGTTAIQRGATTVVTNYNVSANTENLVVNGSTAGNNTYNVTGTSATVSNIVNDGTAAASGVGTFNIQANAVQVGAANVFNGFLGTDTFNVNFAAGLSVPTAAGTTFSINGDAPVSLTATRDVLNINTTAVGDGVRTVGITYVDALNQVDVTGLGAQAFLDINGIETVVYTGDAADNDALTVTGTTASDNITVAPQSLSSALVFLGGNPFDGPPEMSNQLVGLAGGAAGPDMHLRGLATATGLTISGGAGTANHLYVYGTSEAALTDPATAPLDPFGFGAGVLIPGAGVGNAYDNMVVSDAVVRFTAAPVPAAADVRVRTNIATATFLQTAPTATGLTVNSGDEAAPGVGGVADSIFAALSTNFRIQVNGGNPPPAGAPNGDELNVVAPAEINIWSDQLNPPTVTFNSAGSQQLGFSSIERLTLTPGNGVVNVIGDNNNPATPQADTFIIQGDGQNRFDLSINGSAPIQFLAMTALNVLGGLLDDTTAVTPFATAIQEWDIVVTVDGGAANDRLIYTNVAGLFDDTHVQATGLGAGRINAHGIGAHTTDQVIRFLGTEQVTVLANAGDADALTLDLTTAADAVTFVFDPATAPVTPPITGGTGLPGQPVAQVGNDILLTNLFNLVVDANNSGLVVNGDAGADTFLVNLNLAAAGSLPLAITINAGTGADAITLQGNAGADTFNNLAGINPQDGTTSLDGTDTAAVSYTGVEALVYDGGAGGADVVNLTGTPGNDTVTVTEDELTASGTATISAQPGITFTAIGTAGANPVRVATFGGDDEITFNQAVVWGITQVSVDAGPPTGSDTFQVNGTANQDDFTFNPTTRVVAVTPMGGATVTYTPTNVERFVLDGASPAVLPGDLLTVTSAMNGIATLPSGTLTASGLVLDYQNFERIVVDAVPTQADDANTAAGMPPALPRALEDAAVILDVLANDTFATSIGIGGATIQLATLPTNGTVQILAANDPANPTSLTPATAHQVVRYTPAANFFGTDTFTYRAVDRNGQVSTAAATVTVTVNPVNDEPTFALTNTPVVVAEDAAGVQSIQVATGISVGPANELAAGQTAAFTVTNSNNALFTVQPAISATGVLTFTLAPNQNGSATVTVFLQDTGGTADGGDNTSPTVQFALTVTPVNDAPTLSAALDVTTNEDTPVGVPGIVVSDVDATVPAATDFDVTVTLALSLPAIGTLTVSPASGVTVGGNGSGNVSISGPRTRVNAALGTLVYTPNANRNGTDTITVTVDDQGNIGGGNLTATDTIVVTVTAVNDAPVANPDFATTAEDTPVTIDVRANDTDVETAPTALVVAIATAPLPAQGTVAVVANQIVFTPALNFNGTATFTYTVTDTGDGASPALTSAPALVTVTVTAVNDAPVNGVPGAQTTAEDTPLVFTGPNALTVGDPADGDQGDMTATVTVTNGRFTLSTVAGLAVNGNGTATVELTGTVAAVNAALAGASYTPNANFNGAALLTLTTSDNGNVGAGPGIGLTDSDTVAITVTPVNDAPVANPDSATTAEDTPVTIDVRANDTDVETAPAALIVAIATAPLAAQGTVAVVANQIVFTPALNFNGTATFTYTVTDTGDGASPALTSAPALVTVTVTAVNDAPVNGVPGAQTTAEDTPLIFTGPNALTVSDPADGDQGDMTATVTVTNGRFTLSTVAGLAVSGNGTATVELTGTVVAVNAALAGASYTPNANFNGAALLTLTTSDNGNVGTGPAVGLTDSDTVAITVTAVNDAPVANPDFATTAEDTPVTIDVRANDTDVETAPGALVVAIGTAPLPAQGTVTVIANQVVFTPALNFNGTATFTYTVTDTGDGASPALTSAPALVTVTVTAVNDAPVNGVPGAQTTAEDTPLIFTGPNALTVSDPADGDQGDMTATVTVTNGRFTLSTVAGLAVSGNGTATVELTGTVAAVNAALAGASYTPNANFNGAALLTLTTSDNGNVGAGPANGLTDSDTVAITVTAVNDVPTVTGTAATTPEDTAVDIDLKPFVTDVETPAGLMTYNLGGATNGAVAYLGNGLVRFTPAMNYSGPASFTYSVTDGGDGAAAPATSNTATVTVTVTPVADAPTLAVTSPVAGNEGAAIPLTIAAALVDPSETLTISITGFPDGTVFSAGVNDGVTVQLTPAQLAGLTATFPDNGTFNLQVIATSTEIDNSTATTPAAPAVNLVVTVNTVNPTATLGNGGPVNEGSTGTVSFTNQADQSQADVVAGLRYSYDFDNDGNFEIGNGTYVGSVTTATATVPAGFLADGPATRTVGARIIDKDGGFTNYTTIITVNNVAPTAAFGVGGPLVPGQQATVIFSNQADPSPVDVAAGFRYQYDLGTGVYGPPTTPPTATFTPPAPGAFTIRGRIIDKDGGLTEYSATAGVGAGAGQVVVPNVDMYVVGAAPGGGPIVNVYRAFDNSLVATLVAYEPGFRGGVNAAVADVTGDGIPDVITGTGPGGGPVVKVFDGATFALLASFFAYEPSFRGGVTVAAGDVTGTGVGSIITGSGVGGGPVVKVFSGTGTELRSFLAYGETQRGGVNVGVGRLNPTGPASIITGAGRGGAPHVKTFTAAGAQQLSFFAYDTSFTGGVNVSGGRLYGTATGSIVTGTGFGGGPVLRIFDGVTGVQQVSTVAFGPDAYGRSLREGFTVSASHVGGATGEPRIIVGSGPNYGPTVRVLNGATLAQVSEFIPYEDGFDGGVFVG